MAKRMWAAATGIAILAAPVSAQNAGERLIAPADPAFAPGVVHEQRGVFMREAVPKGEKLDDWTRMITVQRFPWRPGVMPEMIADALAQAFLRICSVDAASPAKTLTVGGHPAADLRVDCPVNPQTGKPEVMFGRVILGDEMIHMIQVAFRHVPSATEIGWAERTIAESVLCARASSEPRCR